MPVRPARRADLQRSVDHLSSPDAVTRESAVARLLLAGARAIPLVRELVATGDASTRGRVAGLQTLGLLDRGEAVIAAIACVASPDETLAAEAVEVLGQALTADDSAAIADRALEHLTQLALSPGAANHQRTRAVQLLRQLPAHLIQPVLDALEQSPSLAGLTTAAASSASPLLSHWIALGHLPADESTVMDALDVERDLASVTDLHRLIEMLRSRAASGAADRAEWDRVRGEVHRTLAERGSTIALYDLREALAFVGAEDSPGLLVAAQVIADVSCLEAVTARWLNAEAGGRLREEYERVFRSIVERARLRRTSPAITRLLKRWPAAGPLVATAPRSRPAVKNAGAH